ncbi:MAG: SprB repeat-containing protein, partial [Bacteroidales bacterium]|nr:SprB repeat-containing protein [Bacteroidales bacterium]
MNRLIPLLFLLLSSSSHLWCQLTVEITENTDPSCHGYADGTATVVISGGTEPYDVLWDDDSSSTGLTVTGLAADRYYRVTVTDSTMATEKDSVILSQPDGVSIILDSLRNNPCLGLQEAAIYISASGGNQPYQYDWSGPGDYAAVTEDIENLGEGMYNLDLTDIDGCISNFQQAIVDEDPISLSYTLSSYEEYNLECYGDSSGSITIDTVAGNGMDWRNYTYIWNGPGGFKSYVYEIDSLEAGNYHLNVFDSLNCRSDVTISLTAPDPIFVNYDSVINNPCLNTADGAIY